MVWPKERCFNKAFVLLLIIGTPPSRLTQAWRYASPQKMSGASVRRKPGVGGCRAVFKAGIFCGFQSRNFHFGRLVKRRMGFCSLCGGAARTERWPVGWRQRTTLDPGE